MTSRSMTLLAMFGLGLGATPAVARAQGDQGTLPHPAVPGTVNYVEGAVYLSGSQLKNKDVGNASVEPGNELSTGKGKAEMLLTPGVFVRLDDNSSLKMISPDLAMTQVELEKGRAGVEVDEIHEQNESAGDRWRSDYAFEPARLLRVRRQSSRSDGLQG